MSQTQDGSILYQLFPHFVVIFLLVTKKNFFPVLPHTFYPNQHLLNGRYRHCNAGWLMVSWLKYGKITFFLLNIIKFSFSLFGEEDETRLVKIYFFRIFMSFHLTIQQFCQLPIYFCFYLSKISIWECF